METVAIAVLSCTSIFFAIRWIRNKQIARALLWYILENRYTEPTLQDLKGCYQRYREAKRRS